MANCCNNFLTVSGDAAEVKRFMFSNLGLPAEYSPKEREQDAEQEAETEPRFCFNALVPVPQEVLELGFDADSKIEQIRQTQGNEAADKLIDGYHWCCANWGTKRDIYIHGITPETAGWKEGATKIEIYFGTAWNPPISWLKTVAQMFPTLRLQLCYDELQNSIAGKVLCSGGTVFEDPYDKERCDALYEELYG